MRRITATCVIAALTLATPANAFGELTMSLEVPVSCQGGLVPDVQFVSETELYLGEVVQRCNVWSQSVLFHGAAPSSQPIKFLIDDREVKSVGGVIAMGTRPAFSSTSTSLSVDTEGMSREELISLLQSVTVNVSSI